MGEGTALLGRTDGARREPAAIEREISGLRSELSCLIGELDRRRHDMLDVKLQVKRHAVPISVTAVALLAATAGTVVLQVWRARQRRTVLARAGRLREAVSRMIDRPERVAAEPGVGARIAAAAGSAAAAFVIKAALEQAWHGYLRQPPRRAQ